MAFSPHGIRYSSHRPVVMGRRGMVCASHPLASQAGVRILQKGGNAVDASVAVAAALNVVEPLMSGIGGDGFIMVYSRADDTVKVVNATGPAPYAATRERYLPEGIPIKGILSMSVPGLLRGWTEAHERYGVLSLSEVLEPAVELAEEGFPVSHTVANAIAADELLCQFPTSAAIFTRDGRSPKGGRDSLSEGLGPHLPEDCPGGSGRLLQRRNRPGRRPVCRGTGWTSHNEGPGGLSGTMAGLYFDRISGLLGTRGTAQLQRSRAFAGVEPGGTL